MLRNLLVFLHALYRLLYSVFYINTFYFKKTLYQSVAELYQQKGEDPDPKYFKRIYYHGMLGSITNEWFTTLRGYGQNRREARAGFYLGAATAVYDDLFDHLDFTMDESLEDLAKGRYKYDTITERLSKFFYDTILDNLTDPKGFNEYLKKVGLYQEESKQQATEQLSEAELRRITFEKGGFSLALSRSILDHPYRANEADAVYKLGRLIQLTDDVFDIRRDHLSKVDTLATITTDIRLVQAEYKSLIEESFRDFQQLGYPPAKVRRFLMQVMIIVSRGLVCLDQMVKVQQKHGDTFQIEKYSRAELVCDMERPINLLRSFWYCLTWKYIQPIPQKTT